MLKTFCFCTTIVLLQFHSLMAQGLPETDPQQVGLSRERFARLRKTMCQYVEENRIAGVVALVSRHGKTAFLEAVGMQDIEANKPMQKNTIMRIASMTKAVTSVAVMMLYEEGHFLLTDPVSKYIPEFESMNVLVESSTEEDSVVQAEGPIRIHHLLTHTAGFSYPWHRKVGRYYEQAKISAGVNYLDGTLSESMKRLASIPLVHQPGERYEYGYSTDLLGYLVEIVSGKSLRDFFRERIFEPLRMIDTHFYLPDEKASRLATVYGYDSSGGLMRQPKRFTAYNLEFAPYHPEDGPGSYYSGGGGLCSTALDYSRFLQMLLNGGQLDGVRVLSRKSVELMTTDHLKDKSPSQGLGFGFSVHQDLGELRRLGSIGAYDWGSIYFGQYFVDPREQMVAIILGQLLPAQGMDLVGKFFGLVYQAIVD